MKTFFVLLLLAAVLLSVSGCSKEYLAKKSCEDKGGEWRSVYNVVERNICIMPYADAGKICTSSSECEGDCVTNNRSQMGKEGTCEKTTWSGACDNKIESGYFECTLDDIRIRCDSNNWDSMCDNIKGRLFVE